MNKALKICSLSLLMSSIIVGCSSDTNLQNTASTSQSMKNTIQQSALDTGARVAKWQIDNIKRDNYDYLATRYHKGSSEPKSWIQAAFYIGLTRWAETVKDPASFTHIEKMASEQKYELLLKRRTHADDHAIGQTYLWLTENTGNKLAYQPTQKLFDELLENPSTTSLDMKQPGPKRWAYESPCQDRWCWSDALFMAPRTWLKMSNITGNPKYFDFADKEFWATVNYLFSEQYGLFFRDSHYFDKVSDNGKPVFWSRGNGWVFAALPLLIDDLPVDHPSREKYINLYKKNAAGLVSIQNANGYWAASLLDPNKVKTPETSGTGFITFGLAWGVNNGILTQDKYKQAVTKGWKALEDAVQPNGRVNWVQQVGKSPDPVSKHETQFYGVGAVLLAASEMTKWKQ